VESLRRKAAALVGDDGVDDLRFAVCAREQVTRPPPGVLAVTAADVFSSIC